VSDWTWEYVPDTASVVGGLTSEQIAEVEALAARLADAVGVRRIGTPLDLQEAVSGLKTYGEGSLLIWFMEDYRDDPSIGHVSGTKLAGAPRWLERWTHCDALCVDGYATE
jgi:hypothetical protein